MHENIVRIKAVANLLNGLKQPYVFVGGATVSLYASNPETSGEVRPTNDVDIVVELATYKAYTEIDERLRQIGFMNDTESGVICRYKIDGIIVDVMPTKDDVIGFSNRWYAKGFDAAISFRIDNDTEILLFSLPYFLASKWEAHKSRGGKDLRMSRDFEDIVYVLENNRDFDEELLAAPEQIRIYFREELSDLINQSDFDEGIYCHMEGNDPSSIIQKLKRGIEL